MQATRFDELSKTVARCSTRRQALRAITVATIGGMVGLRATGTAYASNSACAQFCATVFGADTPAADRCASDAAHHTGLCYSCGPASPGGAQPICCTQTSSGYCSSYGGATCCGSSAACLNGSCCPTANICGSTCVDLQTNASNCGSCGNVCQPSSQCQAPSCVNGQCTSVAAPNGTACNDGDACTQSDSCQNGVCVGGTPVPCAALDQCHLAGTCNPVTGVCSNPIAANGTACNPGTGSLGTCQSGVCVVNP